MVHYHVHKNLLLVPVLSQMNPIHILTLNTFTIHYILQTVIRMRPNTNLQLSKIEHFVMFQQDPILFRHLTGNTK
jgi:hypothetical protein